jgi:hypothetical protein
MSTKKVASFDQREARTANVVSIGYIPVRRVPITSVVVVDRPCFTTVIAPKDERKHPTYYTISWKTVSQLFDKRNRQSVTFSVSIYDIGWRRCGTSIQLRTVLPIVEDRVVLIKCDTHAIAGGHGECSGMRPHRFRMWHCQTKPSGLLFLQAWIFLWFFTYIYIVDANR